MSYDYKQIHYNPDLGREPYAVKGYKDDGYPSTSVCAGMTRVDFLDSYASEAEAIAAHPELAQDGEVSRGHALLDADLKDVSHISDGDDMENYEIECLRREGNL